MTKKKRSIKSLDKSYANNPFTPLKGFAVSEQEEASSAEPVISPVVEKERSFVDEMDFLGVAQLVDRDEVVIEPLLKPQETDTPVAELSDEESFLAALGSLDVRFDDAYPTPVKPATPRRFKLLKQGRLTPDASLDLHGLQRHQVAEKIEIFLQNALYQGWKTLLIVTGRGLHSLDGEPVLRDEVEKYLAAEGKPLIAEWSRAPRRYGGEGALVVFLKKTTQENE